MDLPTPTYVGVGKDRESIRHKLLSTLLKNKLINRLTNLIWEREDGAVRLELRDIEVTILAFPMPPSPGDLLEDMEISEGV